MTKIYFVLGLKPKQVMLCSVAMATIALFIPVSCLLLLIERVDERAGAQKLDW